MFIVPVTRETRHFARLLDGSLERFFAPASATATAAEDAPRSPALDVAETEQAYTVKLDVPGVAKEDIKVSIDGRQVSVQATSQSAEAAKDGERVVYRERAATRYARTFRLSSEVEQGESGAKLENGVLTLNLAKRSARSASQLTIN